MNRTHKNCRTPRFRSNFLPTMFTVGVFALAVPSANAASYTWTGGPSSDPAWTTTGNWGGSAPVNPGSSSDIFTITTSGRVESDILGTSGTTPADGRYLNQLIFAAGTTTNFLIRTTATWNGNARQLNFRNANPSITVQEGATGNLIIGSVPAKGNVYLGNTLTVTHNGSGTLTIRSPISGAAGAGIIKDGSGTLILSVANTYPGVSTVRSGTLSVTGSGTLGASNVTVEAGAELSLSSDANIIANTAILTVADGGTVSLAAGVNESVYRLQLGSNFAAIGTWGATGSGAANVNDTYFSGTGKVNVLDAPPPLREQSLLSSSNINTVEMEHA